MRENERLAKVLARAGIGSRRRCEALIRAGRVRVNGKVVIDVAQRVHQDTDLLEVDGRPVEAPEEKVTFLLYKPAGYVSTVHDPWGRPTVLDLLGHQPYRVYPVGRLDIDTWGLLLLTNDGELAQMLTHPRHEVEKTYQAVVRGRPGRAALAALRSGVMLEDGRTAPAKVKVLACRGIDTTLEISLHEGRKRQIKRMCQSVGHPVLKLERTRLSFLDLAGLAPGQYRLLTAGEVDRLKLGAKAGGAIVRQSEK